MKLPYLIATEIIAKEVSIERGRHNYQFDPLLVLSIDDLLQSNEGKVHL